MELDGDCTTTETILIPDGFTFDGNGHTITAVDPDGSYFKGAVVTNEGSTAAVKDVHITTEDLSSCGSSNDGGEDTRLRGILFDGASGTITRNNIIGLNRGASGCQEGNAIEVRNGPFDGTHPNTQLVEISHNQVSDYQKTGILANGDIDVSIHHNNVGASATQENLAANSIQLGYGALGTVMQNHIDGNQWFGTSDFAASAVLVYDADAVTVVKNDIRGNSDIGIFLVTDGATVDNNRVFDGGPDHPNSDYDVGVWSNGDNDVTKNKVRGFDEPYLGVEGGQNITIPGPQPGNPSF
ncbi:MAG: right-handed parallel beta-helix repeat-containing protein [Chloroflexota bacterium]